MHFITTSWWALWRLKSSASRVFTQSFIQGAYQRKYQSSVSLAFVWGIHRWPVNSPPKGPITRTMFPFDDVIMVFGAYWLPGNLNNHVWSGEMISPGLGRGGSNFKCVISEHMLQIKLMCTSLKLLSGECHMAHLIIVYIGSGYVLVPLSTRALPESILTEIYSIVIWRH